MRNQQNIAIVDPSHTTRQPGPVKFVSFDTLDFNAQDMYKMIELRAYERYKARGEYGNDWEDWFVAEREVQLPVPVRHEWEGDTFVIVADVPGFREIEIGRGKTQLIIGGRLQPGRFVRKANWIHKAVDLPEEVDSNRATARLSDGQLEIRVPKKDTARVGF